MSTNQEVVVKNVGAQVSRLAGIIGATVLGNGEIVLILNPVQLIARAPVAQVIRYEQLSMLRDAFPPFDDDDGRDALRLPSRSNPRTVAFAHELRARHADDRALVAAALPGSATSPSSTR